MNACFLKYNDMLSHFYPQNIKSYIPDGDRTLSLILRKQESSDLTIFIGLLRGKCMRKMNTKFYLYLHLLNPNLLDFSVSSYLILWNLLHLFLKWIMVWKCFKNLIMYLNPIDIFIQCKTGLGIPNLSTEPSEGHSLKFWAL